MSVNPLNNFINGLNAQYFTKAETVQALQSISSLSSLGVLFTNPVVSTITVNPTGSIRGGASLSTTALFVSSINGAQFDSYGDVQRADVNNFGLTGKVLQPFPTFTPLLSSITSFNWNSNGLYSVGMPFSATVASAPGDSAATVVFGLGHRDTTTPAAVGSVWTVPGQSNQQMATAATCIIDPPNSSNSPLVLWGWVQNSSSNATVNVSMNITGGAVPITVNRIA